MPRHARVAIAGCPSHIVQRGVDRAACFVDDADRRVYLHLLKAFARQHACAVHAYVLMTNHVHLLATPSETDGVSRMMKALGEQYVPYFNQTHRRTGTLWEGRFKSNVVQSDRYLFTCQRYIELNPVRARMVLYPRDYAWSSYAANAMGDPSGLITPHEIYLALGSDRFERSAAYCRLFRDPSEIEIELIRTTTINGYALSTEQFARELETRTKRRLWPPKMGRPSRPATPTQDEAEPLRLA